VVTRISVVVLQLEKRRGRCATCRNREEGEKHAQRRPSLEAGEGGIAPANFNGGDVPSVAHSGQGVEGGKEGRCAERLEVSREQRGRGGGQWRWPAFLRVVGRGLWGVQYQTGAGAGGGGARWEGSGLDR
jgi:hypothetical protein